MGEIQILSISSCLNVCLLFLTNIRKVVVNPFVLTTPSTFLLLVVPSNIKSLLSYYPC